MFPNLKRCKRSMYRSHAWLGMNCKRKHVTRGNLVNFGKKNVCEHKIAHVLHEKKRKKRKKKRRKCHISRGVVSVHGEEMLKSS